MCCFSVVARQKQVEHTGFFSNVREPYHDLGPPELDSAMLLFRNMHGDLLVDVKNTITKLPKIFLDFVRHFMGFYYAYGIRST